MNLVEYTEFLVKSICPSSELVKVSSYTGDDDITILDVFVPGEAMGAVIGRDGKNAKAIRTMVQAYAYLKELGRIKVNIDSF